jgi:hypothetical protein
MKYMLLLYTAEGRWAQMAPAEQQQNIAAYTAFTEALSKSGNLVNASRLKSVSAATTVRITNGKAQVLDGPFADTKEQLGGFYLIDVPDLDAALSWAARCPAAGHGVVEIRPLWN